MERNELTTKVILPRPSDETAFFVAMKELSNKFWQTVDLEEDVYGFQIQRGAKWRDGLSSSELEAFENELGFPFPEALRNFYRTMNGLDRPGINIFANSGHPYAYRPVFYSYPEDLKIIRERIEWIFEANQTNNEKLKSMGASRIFPVYGHRFMLVDDPETPILSMYGSDIIYWRDSLSKLLATEIFRDCIENENDFVRDGNSGKIKFWLG